MAQGTGQTINDRLNAVRYALVGQGLARTVCKATTEEVLGPKRKHIEYLISCTNEPNVSIPQLANLLIERTQHSSWAVVFKALTTIHHLMSHGNERFTQYLATSNHSFELADFMDRTTPQGYSMSTFVRRYSKYINQKTSSYRTLAIDLCKIRTGNDNALRTMNMDNLSKTLPIVQGQFNCLLEFSAEAKDLSNGIIMAAFRLLYKDLVRLYVAYQEAIINLLERFFKLSRRKTREALEMYKQYLGTMDKVADFLRIVDAVDLDKSDMPDLTNSPASILSLLEKHLAQLEAKKKGGATPVSQDGGEDSGIGAGNKENEKPDSTKERTDETNKLPSTTASSESSQSKEQSKAIASGSERPAAPVEKPPPPQKPARPSPKASPKVSPTTEPARPPPSQKAATSSAQAASTPAASEKKGPPERPAKPPSRPPPPAATAPAPSSSPAAATSQPPAPPAHPSPPKTVASPTPPPLPESEPEVNHDPQPSSRETQDSVAAASESAQADAQIDSPVETEHNDAGTTDEPHDATTNGQSSSTDDQAPQPPSTCGSAIQEVEQQQQQEEDGTNELETNHVNNANVAVDDANANGGAPQLGAGAEEVQEEFVPPPPPPPIQDGDLENQHEQDGEQVLDDESGPVANGQEANNEAANE